jgi:hypothetical protein
MIYTVVSSTLFKGFIPGGSMPMGPCGVLAIEDEHCPKWLKTEFDQSEIDGEDAKDEQIIEMKQLLEKGHATIVPCVRYMHISSSIRTHLFGEDESEDESEDKDDKKDAKEEGVEKDAKRAKCASS